VRSKEPDWNEAAPSAIMSTRWQQPFLAWLDGVEAGWAIPVLLIAFAVSWATYFILAYAGIGLSFDVLETWTLGRHFDWGGSKHPPLMGWTTGLWTLVFPATTASLECMAMANAALALFAVDLITRQFVRGNKRAIVILLLMLTPVYQFHAERFNANTVLLAAWPIATWCFLRSFETRRPAWALAAGFTAALCMLGKYYSIFLLGSFLTAAIVHPQRRGYFRSSAPWIAVGAGIITLSPHIHWLRTTGAPPFAYALKNHMQMTLAYSVGAALIFIAGLLAALSLPTVCWLLMVRGRLGQLREDFHAMPAGLWLIFLIGASTILLPIVTCVVMRTEIQVVWALHGLFFFVVVLVCAYRTPIPPVFVANLAAMVLITTLVALLIAPVQALYRHSHPLTEGRVFYAPAIEELTRQWHERYHAPLPAVGGHDALALALAFYSKDHPEADQRLMLPNRDARPLPLLFPQGWAELCLAEDENCILGMSNHAPNRFSQAEFTVRTSLWGIPGASQRFVYLMAPPGEADNIPACGDETSVPAMLPSSRWVKPIGRLDLPPERTIETYETIRLSGWALDENRIRCIIIERDPVPDEIPAHLNARARIEIGKAAIMPNSRPDVGHVYPEYPDVDRAGWIFDLRRDQIPSKAAAEVNIFTCAVSFTNVVNCLGMRKVRFGMERPRKS